MPESGIRKANYLLRLNCVHLLFGKTENVSHKVFEIFLKFSFCFDNAESASNHVFSLVNILLTLISLHLELILS